MTDVFRVHDRVLGAVSSAHLHLQPSQARLADTPISLLQRRARPRDGLGRVMQVDESRSYVLQVGGR